MKKETLSEFETKLKEYTIHMIPEGEKEGVLIATGTEEIFDFIHDFRVAQVSERKYINLTRKSSFISELTTLTGLPLTSYFLGNEDINKVLSHRF